MKKIIYLFCLIFIGSLLISCDKDITISSIEIASDEVEFDENFQLSDISIKVIKSDGTEEFVPLTSSMLSEEDLAKFQQVGLHTINVMYLDQEATFTINITAEPGEDGQEVVLQVADGYIQWKYENDTTWTNLISLDVIKGEAGSEIEFQTTTDYIQWRYLGDTTWTNLLSLNLIKGTDGITPTISISDDNYWVINGVKTDKLALIVPVYSEYTVTFDSNGGLLPDGIQNVLENVKSGSTITLPTPQKENYQFLGWYNGDCQFTCFDTVTNDITLVAKWGVDLTELSNFLNIFNSYNYTVHGTSTLTIDDVVEIDTMLSKVQEINGEINVEERYNLNQTNEEIDYIVYKNGLGYHYNKTDNQWILYKLEQSYEALLFANAFDLNKFTKQPDANIFVYPVDEEILMKLGILSDYKKVPEFNFSGEITINLDLMKITFHIVFEQLDGIIDQVYEMVISNVNTTTVVFPVNDVKATIISGIDNYINAFLYLDIMTDESLASFNQRIIEMKALINSEISLEKIYEYDELFILEISDYPLVIDELKQLRKQAIENLESLFDNLSITATDASILEMNAILNEYIILINSGNFMEVQAYIYQAETELCNIYYVQDPIKEQLRIYKSNVKDYLYDKIIASQPYIYDFTQIDNIYNEYNVLIDNASDKDEVNILYNEAMALCKKVVFDNLDYHKYLLRMTLLDLYNEGLYYNPQYSETVINEYNNHISLIEECNNYFVANEVNANAYISLKNSILAYTKSRYQDLISNQHEYILKRIIDSEIPTLNGYYTTYSGLINDEVYLPYIKDDYDLYFAAINSLTEDPLKVKKLDTLYIFESSFDEYCITATDSSISDMETVFTTYTNLINSALTIDEVNTTAYEGILALEAAYVIDSVKYDLYNARKEALKNIYSYQTIILTFVSFEDDESKLVQLNIEYVELISQATTLEQVNLYYNTWYEKLTQLYLHVDQTILYNTRIETLNTMYNTYNYITNNIYDNLPQPLMINYYEDYFRICDSYYLIDLVEVIQNNIEFNDELKLYALNRIKEIYEFYIPIIPNSNYAQAGVYYDNYNQIINESTDYEVIINSINHFEYELMCLQDPTKDVYSLVYEFNYRYEYLQSISTDAGIVAMQSIYDAAMSEIALAVDYSEVETMLTEKFNLISLAFDLDLSKKELLKHKIDLSDLIYLITYDVSNYIDEYDYLEFIGTKYQYLMSKATTSTEADAIYLEWFTFVQTNFNYTILEEDRIQIKAQLQYNIDYYISVGITFPTTFDADHQALINIIDTSDDLFVIYQEYYNFDFSLWDEQTNEDNQEYIDSITDKYNEFYSIIIDSELTNLEETYNQYLVVCEGIFYDYYAILEITRINFENYLSTLTIDSVKLESVLIINLTNEFNTLALTATPDSVIAMQAVVTNFETEIDLLTTPEEMYALYDTFYINLHNAYIAA